MNTVARLLIVIVLVVVASSFASAEILTVSDSVLFTAGNQSGTIDIPRFNSALGTLNSITVTFWDSGQGIFSGTAANGIDYAWGIIDRGYSVTGVGFTNFAHSYTVNGIEYADLVTGEMIGPETISFNHPSASVFTITSTDYGLYTGTGSVSYAVSDPKPPGSNFRDSATVATGGTLNFNITESNLGVGATVIYNYTSDPGVPEPSSLALLPMALTGLMFWRRRRTA